MWKVNFDWNFSGISKTESENDSDEYLSKRKDYCYDCKNEELYPHAMTLKCSKCHKIILGGSECREEDRKK